MIAVAVIALLLSLGGLILSIYRLIISEFDEVTDFITHPLLILACLFCLALTISILYKSQYVVTTQECVMQFGFIKSWNMKSCLPHQC